MPLYHTEDQAMLADTARPFMGEEGTIAKQLRHWRDIAVQGWVRPCAVEADSPNWA